jgi:hypothetical protein
LADDGVGIFVGAPTTDLSASGQGSGLKCVRSLSESASSAGTTIREALPVTPETDASAPEAIDLDQVPDDDGRPFSRPAQARDQSRLWSRDAEPLRRRVSMAMVSRFDATSDLVGRGHGDPRGCARDHQTTVPLAAIPVPAARWGACLWRSLFGGRRRRRLSCSGQQRFTRCERPLTEHARTDKSRMSGPSGIRSDRHWHLRLSHYLRRRVSPEALRTAFRRGLVARGSGHRGRTSLPTLARSWLRPGRDPPRKSEEANGSPAPFGKV